MTVDQEAGYAAAHEHALTGRYREARELLEKILHKDPSHLEALILLGKVEYYLGHATRSRRCFETVLMYDPASIVAFFAIEHYRARRRAAWSAGCAIVLAALLAGVAVVAARQSVALLGDASAQVGAAVEALSRSVQELERSVEEATGPTAEVRQAVRELAGDSRSGFGEVASELERIRRVTETLARGIEELRLTVDRPPSEDGTRH